MRKYYSSPRWSGEILDCSMPMTFDTYDKCYYDCLYCFSFFQKAHSLGKGGSFTGKHQDYQKTLVHGVNEKKIEQLFRLQDENSQFAPYIRSRKTFQWGGLADPFDENERQYGVTLRLLKFFKSINYPICFSTKATWFAEDDRYLSLIKNQKNWNFKFSIINLDPKKSHKMERKCPSPEMRLCAMQHIVKAKAGGATLRLRPFILGMSDVGDEYLALIRLAKEHGAGAVSTEFMCLEGRADDHLRQRYFEMSSIIGFDIFKYYRKNSVGSGYLRLTRTIKSKFMQKMKSLCDQLGLRFYVSDAHFKELCANGSCCGLPESWNYSRGQFTHALYIAKQKGTVHFSDISEEINFLHGGYLWNDANGYNTSGVTSRASHMGWTMAEYMRAIWNSPKGLKSPYKYFGGILVPIGVDKNKDVVYAYRD